MSHIRSFYVAFIFMFLHQMMSFSQNDKLSITGLVLDTQSNAPIEYATIAIVDSQTKEAITGTITAQDGRFSLQTDATHFYIDISFIGYSTKSIRTFNTVNNSIDLKTILLEPQLEGLDEVLIQAETSQTVFKLDKRIFNVGKDLSASGASALEVLNNVPSVSVNIEGAISLRGNEGVQILVNGKPSVLAGDDGSALGIITADMIESIEVITNPSAKYDAQGTSGIINIILKKSEKRGLNGSATLNVGVPNSNSFGLSVNKRTEKFNLFSQLGFGIRTYPTEFESINADLIDDITITNIGDSEFDEKFGNILIGADYYINDRNVITLSGSYAYEVEDQTAFSEFYQTDATNAITDQWNRNENTEATNPKIRYELQYKSDFKRHEDQTLLFSAMGNYFRKDQTSEFNNTTIFGDMDSFRQESRTDYKLEDYIFKLDYTHPFLEYYTLEIGSQYTLNKVSNDYAVSNFTGGVWVEDPFLTNIFDLNQNVFAAYTTAAYEANKWGFKLGLRLENTVINTLLETTNETDNQNYTNLFPSAYASYNVSDDFSLQLGYSSRINRPSLRQLNPFSNIRNNYSISEGNPELQPEYTNSYELTGIQKFDKLSFSMSLYHWYTTDVIEYITVSENNVSISRPENVGTNNTTGFEANGKYRPLDWLTINGDFNFNYFDRNGYFELQSFDFTGNRWSTTLTAKVKLPADFDFEISENYNSKYKTLQQEVSAINFVDLGVRKKIVKGRIILNLSIRDVFATRVDETVTSEPDFYLYNSRQRGRFVNFGISYGFGKGEAMQFSGQRR
ncbi:TonB-dependent receptor domain-containing protein [Xanthomarina spongicola]|uniref:Outer membrane receptor for ferrienterochelin and colicin n=1 Tax=Xanthomarina spongicola TaxID=570520 RepID=A0A316DNU3_9FLAO|nr:TonB-dependent receptor [Xanthomarina spongicola]PWK19867.1 outer membrane receptor for ferrienterochelin and colicin [Xanthomarina spongicola]